MPTHNPTRTSGRYERANEEGGGQVEVGWGNSKIQIIFQLNCWKQNTNHSFGFQEYENIAKQDKAAYNSELTNF